MQRKIAIITVTVLVTIGLLTYSLKSPVFRYIVSKKVQSIERKFGVTISYSNASLKGITSINFTKLSIKSKPKQTYLNISSASIKLSVARLIIFNLTPKDIDIDSLQITSINSKNKYINRQNSDANDTIDHSIELSRNINSISASLLRNGNRAYKILTTSRISINYFSLSYESPIEKSNISTSNFKTQDGFTNTQFAVNQNNVTNLINLTINADRHKNSLKTKIFADGKKVHIPIVKPALGLSMSFDSLTVDAQGESFSHDSVNINLKSALYGAVLRHNIIADSNVIIDSASLFLSCGVTPERLSIIAPSFLKMNKLQIPFTLDIANYKQPKVQLEVNTGTFAASNLFGSLPQGLFPNLQGISVRGNLQFDLFTQIDFANPDSLAFSAKLTPENFSITAFGNINFRQLNNNFSYYIPLTDSSSKRITIDSVGYHHPSLSEISPNLVNAVVVSEDGGFFYHKGFDSEGFKFALARNIKDKRLGRGGSTITMQLVKNLYLNKNKTITRKAEEALIVWLIENQRLVSKERMLEIYLNIIDWGPQINGITEASKFYFNKKPKELDLNEAIFLASIIPRPSQFQTYFNEDGNLKEYLQGYFKFISRVLLERGLISESDLEQLVPNVVLYGEARHFIESRNSNIE